MTYNLLEEVKDYDGSTLPDDTNKPVTYKSALVVAMNTPLKNHEYTAEEKMMADSIIRTAYKNPESADYTADEVTLILTRIKAAYATPLIPASADRFFNQKN